MNQQKAPLEDRAKSIDSFCLEPEREWDVVYRSGAQNSATCPAMARYIEEGLVDTSSNAANAGQAVHDAISIGIQYYTGDERWDDDYDRKRLQEVIEVAMRESRPDVQPEAIKGLIPSVWAITDLLDGYGHPTPPNHIHRFDGGTGDRSGQLGWRLPEFSVIASGELDLLIETSTPETWRLFDWKSGKGIATAEDVKVGSHSFQFAFYVWLIFENYEHVQTVIVTIWNTRINQKARDVVFLRENMAQYKERVRSAIKMQRLYRDTAPEQCPTWPSVEKCTICNAAHLCPVSGYSLESAEECLGVVVALRAQLAAREKRLTAIADKRGAPIEWKDARWGRDAPKDPKKPTAKLWKVKP